MHVLCRYFAKHRLTFIHICCSLQTNTLVISLGLFYKLFLQLLIIQVNYFLQSRESDAPPIGTVILTLINIIIIYFIQIRHSEDFPPTGTPASVYKCIKQVIPFGMCFETHINVFSCKLSNTMFVLEYAPYVIIL